MNNNPNYPYSNNPQYYNNPNPNNPYQQPNYPQNPQSYPNNPNDQRYAPNPYNAPQFNRGTYPNQRLAEQQYYQGGLLDGSRKNFVTKVYGLLSIQLLFTVVISYIGYNSVQFKQTFGNPTALIIISVMLLVLSFVIGCCTQTFRKCALPIFMLFTGLMALLVAISVSAYQSKVVLLTAGVTLLLVLALTIYAWKTDSDLTGCGVYLMVLGLVMLVFGIVAIFWKDPVVQLIYSALSVVLFSIYLIYDTQLIMGTKGRSYSLDDAYLAAIQLYIDIIQLFLHLLRLIAKFQ